MAANASAAASAVLVQASPPFLPAGNPCNESLATAAFAVASSARGTVCSRIIGVRAWTIARRRAMSGMRIS